MGEITGVAVVDGALLRDVLETVFFVVGGEDDDNVGDNARGDLDLGGVKDFEDLDNIDANGVGEIGDKGASHETESF